MPKTPLTLGPNQKYQLPLHPVLILALVPDAIGVGTFRLNRSDGLCFLVVAAGRRQPVNARRAVLPDFYGG